MSDIHILVQNQDMSVEEHFAPTDMGLSLMEFLKGNGYEIPATCGGMALCATCHVEILSAPGTLPAVSDDEHAMLDTLPNLTAHSRLSCQLRLNKELDKVKVRIVGDGLS